MLVLFFIYNKSYYRRFACNTTFTSNATATSSTSDPNPQNNPSSGTATLLAPTAATAMLAGRVTVNTGFIRGSGRLLVTILNTRTLETQVAFTNRLGYYQFNDLPVGDTYVLNVRGKGYSFTPQTFNLSEDSALDMFGTAVSRFAP